jgi:predicted nucleic acid-binding protein
MAQALILDCEALSALAFATQRSVAARRARAILQVAYEEHALVRVPAPVLAEVYRGGDRDAPVDRVVNDRGIEVVDLTRTMAKRAGALLSRARLGSAHAVDAFVIATALAFSSAVIATHDPDDFRRLAAGQPTLRIFAI